MQGYHVLPELLPEASKKKKYNFPAQIRVLRADFWAFYTCEIHHGFRRQSCSELPTPSESGVCHVTNGGEDSSRPSGNDSKIDIKN